METPCAIMAVMAMSKKIIHRGSPKIRSARPPRAIVVNTPLQSLGHFFCLAEFAMTAAANDGKQIAEISHRHQCKAQGDGQ
jgi:hypothetical protein